MPELIGTVQLHGLRAALGRGERSRRSSLPEALVPALLTVAALVGIVSAQGGYFPTSWGWGAIGALLVLAVWLAVQGRTDAARLDAAFLLALGLLTAWVGLSIAWSAAPSLSVAELERGLVLLGGCGAFLLVARKTSFEALAVAVLLAITLVCTYSLGTRLVPDRLGTYAVTTTTSDSYRLSAPVGYWNTLGLLAAMGIVLAIGLATERRAATALRAIGAVSLVVSPLTLYFTYSRGAWLVLAAGLVVCVAVSADRLRLVAEGLLLLLLPALGVVLASRSHPLTHNMESLAAAAHAGHRLAAVVVGLTLASVAPVLLLVRLERRVEVARRWRRLVGATLLLAAVAVCVGAIVRGGGPVDLSRRAYDSFAHAPTSQTVSNLNTRLFSARGSGRVQLWHVAWTSYQGHWLGGTGAGTFERSWQGSPTAGFEARDAHSLYLETLSELGIVGLALLVLTLGIPLAACVAVRRVAFVPAIVGAYCAFLIHNAVDWDWELSGVALSGLLCGCLLLVARREGHERPVPAGARALAGAAVVAAGAFSLVGAIGNGALARANAANQESRFGDAAAEARLAHRWMPWSPEPWLALGSAQLGAGDVTAATASFARAVSLDRRDWSSWLALAATTQGATRTHALARARALFPTSPEIDEFESELAREPGLQR